MNRTYTLLIKAFVLLLLVVPMSSRAESVEAEYRALLLQLIVSLQQQIQILETELAKISATQASEKAGALSASVHVTASYFVADSTEVAQIQNAKHRRYFTRVYELFPETYEEKVKRFLVFDDASAPFDAFVETIPPLHQSWLYAVHEDMLDELRTSWNTELIVHELGHLVSYELVLDSTSSGTYKCNEYFDIHGCPVENSYLGQFVATFWDDSDLARAQRFAQGVDSQALAYDYYDNHNSQFVSDYAAIGPEEDFAESFMYFILDEVSPRGEASEKVAFFEQYDDMRSIRDEIASVR